MKQNPPSLPSNGLQPFAQAMPDFYRESNAPNAYRKYYAFKTTYMKIVWNKISNIPNWWNSELVNSSIQTYELSKAG